MSEDSNLRNFLEIPYDRLEEMNLRAIAKGEKETSLQLREEYLDYLEKEKRIKAVTLCFSDIEGRFHMLDYDKKFLMKSFNNLTFDGSSIRGFTKQSESDLRLEVDWATIRWLPSDVFGPGKVIIFADVRGRDRSPYGSDIRSQLKILEKELGEKKGIKVTTSVEIEGFLVDGIAAEQNYDQERGFKLISTGGYYHSLPLDKLRIFIDKSAEAQRAMGFRNEKDHPEVAPSQFELNFAYTSAARLCDQIQLYKLVCRQIANNMGMTATFLPKPVREINGSGMHLNLSFVGNNRNMFYQKSGKEGLSVKAWDFISKLLNHAPEICLILSSSVNSYRRLDPHFEAPNQIKVSSIDRGAMIRIPVGNEKTARIEIRAVAPDANPYMVLFTILKTGFEGKLLEKQEDKRDRLRFLPDNIYDAIRLFKTSEFTDKFFGQVNKEKFVALKQAQADRCPKDLGKIVKTAEVIYHHEVTNQMLWNKF